MWAYVGLREPSDSEFGDVLCFPAPHQNGKDAENEEAANKQPWYSRRCRASEEPAQQQASSSCHVCHIEC
jgi:hypothetical protein